MSRKIYKRYHFRLKNLVSTSEDISRIYKFFTNHDGLVKEVDFYMTEENTVIPHSVLHGATLEEVMHGKWSHQRVYLIKEKILEAKPSRLTYFDQTSK